MVHFNPQITGAFYPQTDTAKIVAIVQNRPAATKASGAASLRHAASGAKVTRSQEGNPDTTGTRSSRLKPRTMSLNIGYNFVQKQDALSPTQTLLSRYGVKFSTFLSPNSPSPSTSTLSFLKKSELSIFAILISPGYTARR